jgi:uncharacterized LabA/DUF88 family protein
MELRKNSGNCSLETLAIFVDYHNLEGSLRNEGYETDLLSLRDYLSDGRWLLETFIYIGVNPKNTQEDERRNRLLKTHGFLVRSKSAQVRADGSLKCDFDTEMVLDVVDFVQRVNPKIILLVTGDGDFVPLVTWLRLRGVRVEVASIESSISQYLREAANGYVDLCGAMLEMRRLDEQCIINQRKEEATDG